MLMYLQNKWLHFEGRLKQLENDLNKHHEEVGEIKQAIKILAPSTVSSLSSGRARKVNDNFVPIEPPNTNRMPNSEIIYNDSCSFQANSVPRTNIQVN